MLRRVSIFLFLIFLLGTLRLQAQGERDTLFYEIQPDMIEQTRIRMDNQVDKYRIHILLKENYHSIFEQLISENIGNFLAVVHKGEILSPGLPVLQAKISSGRLYVGPFKKEKTAKQIRKQIVDRDE